MKHTTPKYSKEEFARRGDRIYERLAPDHLQEKGRFIAIDIETGNYEIGWDELAITDRLTEHRHEAQVWLRRIGTSHAHHFGPRFAIAAE